MPRRRRPVAPGIIFHVVNRGAKRAALFDGFGEYEEFELLLQRATRRFKIALFAYCLMPNHWHFLLQPLEPRTLSRAMHWLTGTHVRRWQIRRSAEGLGAVYQGRFKAIPVEGDDHFLWVCRYIERNALRAGMVERAEEWRWTSLWQRVEGDDSWIAGWPAPPGSDWLTYVNTPQTEEELNAFRTAVNRGSPFGSETWARSMIEAGHVVAPAGRRGRPKRKTVLEK